jgi:hypothetical protein
MDRMSTIVVKIEHREQALYLERQMSKRDDSSTGTATRAARCGLLLVELGFSYAQARWTQGFLSGSGRPPERKTLRPLMLYCCVCLFKLELNMSCFSAWPTFYRSRSASYMKNRGLTGGPKVVGALLQQLGS